MPDLSSNQIYSILNSFQNLSNAVGRIADAMNKEKESTSEQDIADAVEKEKNKFDERISNFAQDLEKLLDDENIDFFKKQQAIRDIIKMLPRSN